MAHRILFCGEFPRKKLYSGGPAVNVKIAEALLRDNRFQPSFFAPLFRGESPVDFGIPVRFIPTNYLRAKDFGDLLVKLSFTRGVKRVLTHESPLPDLVHIDSNPYLARINPEIPKTLFLYGSSVRTITPASFFRNPYSSLCQELEERHERAAFSNPSVKKVFTSSLYSRNLIVSDYRLPSALSQKIETMRLGYDAERFGKDHISKEEAKRIISGKLALPYDSGAILLFVGGISPHKGQYELVESMPELLAKYPKTCLVLAGKDASDLARCRKRAEELGLADRVFLPGALSDKDLGLLFRAADVYASAAIEGFGINQVEAMGMGLPLVAWDKGAVKELFSDGQEGFLVKNREAFIEKTLALIQDENLRVKMGLRAKAHAETTFSWKKLCEKVLDAYLEVLEKRSQENIANGSIEVNR